MEEQKILAISGKKSSGKNTTCNFIHSIALVAFKCTPNSYIHPETGHLYVQTDENEEGILDLQNRHPEFAEYMGQHVWPFIKRFSFADTFKKLCIDAFGLTEEQIYGTDEQKNTLTKFRWEDMPIPAPRDKKTGERLKGKTTLNLPLHTGFMTAREFMQYIGSEVGREIYEDVWADATIRDIRKSMTGFAIIDDCRFGNEVDVVHKAGGKVLRLTRNICLDDPHQSEHDLDPDRFDWSKFDYIVDNQSMTINQTCDEVWKVLVDLGWVGHEDTK